MRSRQFAAALLAFLFLAACVYAGVGTSGANLSAGRANLGSVTAGDWVAPVVTITTPAANARLDSAGKPTFSGAAGTIAGDATTVTVRIYSGSGTGGTLAQSLPATATGASWSVTPTIALPDGTYTAQAEQGDAAGNLGRSAAVTFTVDRTAPAPTVTAPTGSVQTPTFAGTAGNASGDSSSVTVTVTKAAGSPVTYSGTRTGTTWSATVPTLSEGDYTVTVSQSDDLGHTGTSSAQSFTVDRTAPAVTVTAPTAGSATNATTPVFSGTRGTATGDAAAVTVRLYSGSGTGGTLLQTRAATVTGSTWSVASAASLADGIYTVQASQSDAAANTGTSTAITFTVDTVAPAPTVTAPTGYTGATPALSGAAGNATGDNTSVTVQILSGASVVQTLSPTRAGAAWSTTASTLADGAYTARVTQGDAAGNSATSSAIAFTVDTTAPAPIVLAPAAGSSTSSTTPTLAGNAGFAAGDASTVTVKVYNGAGTGGTLNQTKTPTVSGGTWSVPASTLTDGVYTVTVTQTDAAGNTGTSSPVSFTVDGVAPVVTLDGPGAGRELPDPHAGDRRLGGHGHGRPQRDHGQGLQRCRDGRERRADAEPDGVERELDRERGVARGRHLHRPGDPERPGGQRRHQRRRDVHGRQRRARAGGHRPERLRRNRHADDLGHGRQRERRQHLADGRDPQRHLRGPHARRDALGHDVVGDDVAVAGRRHLHRPRHPGRRGREQRHEHHQRLHGRHGGAGRRDLRAGERHGDQRDDPGDLRHGGQRDGRLDDGHGPALQRQRHRRDAPADAHPDARGHRLEPRRQAR